MSAKTERIKQYPVTSDNDELNQLLAKVQDERALELDGRTSRMLMEANHSEKERENKFDFSACQWATTNNVIFIPTGKTVDTLQPGFYEIGTDANVGLYFERIPVKTEGLLEFPEANTYKVITEIKTFWDSEAQFKHYDLAYKRGIILWGPPGGGKSCTLQLVCQDVISRGGIVLKYSHPSIFSAGYRKLRDIQPDTPIVVLMEDIDSTIRVWSETDVINTLDGIDRMHKVVFLATTNYPELLGARIMNRPSRFDKRYKVGYPNPESRRIYFNHLFSKNNTLGHDIEKWVKDTQDFSIAHMKELFIAVVVLGDDYEEAIKTLSSMKVEVNSWDNESKASVGFRNSC